MLNIENILIKYMNSSEKWILAIPVVENGQIKLRCYMTRRNSLTGLFQDCYTYKVGFQTLVDFYSFKSHGQAYNKLIKMKKVRTGFLKEDDHIQGLWTFKDIEDTIKNGRSVLVLEAVNHLMKIQNRGFTLEPITEEEKEELSAYEQAVNDIYDSLMW